MIGLDTFDACLIAVSLLVKHQKKAHSKSFRNTPQPSNQTPRSLEAKQFYDPYRSCTQQMARFHSDLQKRVDGQNCIHQISPAQNKRNAVRRRERDRKIFGRQVFGPSHCHGQSAEMWIFGLSGVTGFLASFLVKFLVQDHVLSKWPRCRLGKKVQRRWKARLLADYVLGLHDGDCQSNWLVARHRLGLSSRRCYRRPWYSIRRLYISGD